MKQDRESKILTFYTEKQVCFDSIAEQSYSKSPLKPYLLMKRIEASEYKEMLKVVSDFEPFVFEDFLIAHTERYVKNVFEGKGNCTSNSIPWSKNLVESLTYTNSALYNAIRYAYLNPQQVTFAPVSGMHHAHPDSGSGFCTFSGQVIASVKMYNEFKARGVYFDLDRHFGNSIEDAREFNPIINLAVPKGYNVNLYGSDAEGHEYVKFFNDELSRIGFDVMQGKVDYVVFCHGADSHRDDDLGGYCNTDNWVHCATIFAEWVNEVSMQLGRPIPVTLALFGGYKRDNYNAVLDLHTKSIIQISNIICGNSFVDRLEIS
ncbi:MAG TPA: hypothetical protein PKU81_01185 [Bacteroidales bacterium]|nr:hypothetical protein [Bacteroidales bacterium]HQD34091.1 hypothetical protein [Bacteroidales bacterium]